MAPGVLLANTVEFWGGGEKWVLLAARELATRGFRTFVACRPRSALLTRCRKSGVAVFPLPFAGDADPVTIARLRRIYRREGIRIVHPNMERECFLCGLASLGMKGVLVVPRRGLQQPYRDAFWMRRIYRWAIDGIVCNAHAGKRFLMERYDWIDPARTWVIHNGVDPADFGAGGKRHRGPVRVGVIGRLAEAKGHRYLFEAFRGIDASLLVVGDGPLRGDLKKRARELGIARSVRFAGFREDVPKILAALDILVLPSLVEGFPNVLVEAGAAGLPVVATSVAGCREIVHCGKNGFLVPPADARRLRGALQRLTRSAALRARMGKRGRAVVEKRFTRKVVFDRYVSLYRGLGVRLA